MNGDFKIIFDRIEKLDSQNREEHKEIMNKIDEWNDILREQPQKCYQNFVKGSTFWRVIIGLSAAWAAVISFFHLRG